MIPLFKSHYSLGRSILTLEDKDEKDDYPDSIIQICKENKMKELYLVEDNMSSFLEAYSNCRKNNIKLNYGLRISVTESISDKSEESKTKSSKIILFFKNKLERTLYITVTVVSRNGPWFEKWPMIRDIKLILF